MPSKQTADAAGFRRFKDDLSAGTPGRLYLFHGEETYLRDYYLARLREQVLGDGLAQFNFHEISGKEFSPHRLEEVLDCLPVMGAHTFIQATDCDLFKAGEQERESYARLISDLPEYCCLVFVYDGIDYKPDARTKLAAAVKAAGTAVNFQRQEQGDLASWVKRRFKALGKEIDTRLALDLIFLCGDLMTGLIGEIEKIAAHGKGPRVTREDLDAVATPRLDAVVFRMTDAIGRGDFDGALTVLGQLYQMQEPPVKLLWSLGRQMRQLYCARLALDRGGGVEDVARLWNLKPYPAEKLVTSARRFSLPWCRRAVVWCARADLEMKSGGGDGRDLLTALLLRLAHAG